MNETIERIAILLEVEPNELDDDIRDRGAWQAVAERIYTIADGEAMVSGVDIGIEVLDDEDCLNPDMVAGWIRRARRIGREMAERQAAGRAWGRLRMITIPCGFE